VTTESAVNSWNSSSGCQDTVQKVQNLARIRFPDPEHDSE